MPAVFHHVFFSEVIPQFKINELLVYLRQWVLHTHYVQLPFHFPKQSAMATFGIFINGYMTFSLISFL